MRLPLHLHSPLVFLTSYFSSMQGLFKSDVELDQMDREIQDEVTKARVARSSGFNGGVF